MLEFKAVTLATYKRNVRSGKWVPLYPRRPNEWRIQVRVPNASRGVRNVAGRLVTVEIRGPTLDENVYPLRKQRN